MKFCQIVALVGCVRAIGPIGLLLKLLKFLQLVVLIVCVKALGLLGYCFELSKFRQLVALVGSVWTVGPVGVLLWTLETCSAGCICWVSWDCWAYCVVALNS